MSEENVDSWTDAEKGRAFDAVSQDVRDIRSRQNYLYEKFAKMSCMYDPRQLSLYGPSRRRGGSVPSFNLIATSVDSVHASLASQEVRTRIITEGAEWAQQRQARQLQKYADTLSKSLETNKMAKRAVWAASLKGLGLVKVSGTLTEKITVDAVQPDSIFVNDEETENCVNRKLHHRYREDAEKLKANFPDYEKAIDDAKGVAFSVSQGWEFRSLSPGYKFRSVSPNQVIVIESWSLAIGTEGEKGYKPGRHTICIDSKDLLDEEYSKAFYPFALFRWSEGDGASFFGIGGAERIATNQAKLAKLDYCGDKQIENGARPVTYWTMPNITNMQRTVNHTGQYVPTMDGQLPQTVVPQTISGEQLAYRERTKYEGYEAFGTSRDLVDGSVPDGIESGVGVREARATATGRWALQEMDFEQVNLDIIWLILDRCKDLGKDAPDIQSTTFKGGTNALKWADVDMVLVRSQLKAASAIAKTAAGLTSLAMDMAQAGIIDLEESRRLMGNPDIPRSMSLYTAQIESLERQGEEMLDGEVIMPTTFSPLKMGIWRLTQVVLAAESDGAPEDAIERVRNWVMFAIDLLNKKEAEQAAQQAAAMAPEQAPPSLDPTAELPMDALPISAA